MGCSFVQGSELGPDNKHLPNHPVLKVPGRFSEIVADHFNAKHINLAQGGAGQNRIFRSTVDWLNGDSFNPKDRILFLIGLSFPLRTEVWVNRVKMYEKWNIYNEDNFVERVTVSSGVLKDSSEEKIKAFKKDYNKFKRFYLEHIQNEEESIIESYRLMTALRSFIKDKAPNSDIFMFSALGDNFPEYVRKDLKLDKNYFPSWSRYIKDNNLMDPCCWHPKEAAHLELANYIIKRYDK